MMIMQWMGFTRIYHSYEAYCCHQPTCCSIRETKQSLEAANRIDSCREEGGGMAAIW